MDFRWPRLRQALWRTIRSLSSSSLMSSSKTYSSVVPVRPREMAATARTLGSGSESSVIRASITAGFWKSAVCVCVHECVCFLVSP